MSCLLLAEFRDPETLLQAAQRAREAGFTHLDAHTPFRVEGMEEALGLSGASVRTVMLICGLGAAAFAFALQYHSAAFDYPFDIGGRPLNSWQTFVIPSFELGVLISGFSGVVAMLRGSSLPRPHHPVFSAPGFERASQDRFFLSVNDPQADLSRLQRTLLGLSAVSVQEVAG